MSPHSTADLLTRRYATLGEHSPLFYREPLELVRGEGVWLTDATGRTYLDAYNNVPHVGHAHPAVADAVNRQLRTLNLHTRYLNHVVVDYAEALLETFADPLDRLFLVNSGSEANELALRVARQHTGHTGVLVSDFSYHGNTTSLAQLTTGLTVAEPLGDHVRALRIPDAAGLTDAEASVLCASALQEADQAIASLQAAGHGLSAVLFDPLFSTEGLLRPPQGYVEGLAARVRAAGGLVVADEVQSGFGRLGDVMWGHELFDLSPELVTLGKPMGNGHPVGGVVTTAELLDEFGRRNMYFNTFAGSPVSSAAAHAVLRVMDAEQLRPRARQNGEFIAARLEQLAREYPAVASVRGQGLFFGLTLVRPDGSAAPEAARALTERMREAGVLISKIGREDNVLKMRPPMVLERAEAELLLDRLAACLSALEPAA
ncbi:aspartate aminotransferase family protein [Zhihengliuella flava]|uniref:4-aminobutyrate aminotransferase-like enzyme n=1 Tax=Zhihengliuella flava TaxID=1285193 RepID=A0A931DCQ1_9MICC|nr:aminotransferase class III-fold pyridoxal phosphate-dependent enzyme [Zhihengliuella flava]MBG6085126.1 4-aminobutyrate aminotransferase-like enzyme [Zhihengliuella flava]